MSPRELRAVMSSPSNRVLCAALLLFCRLALGCVTVASHGGGESSFSHQEMVETESGVFLVSYGSEDAPILELVTGALEEAAPRLAVWGALKHPVEVRVYPTHDALELAVGRRNYPWLRAWARYDEILLQSPRTFDLFERGSANLAELLTHELTHCLMYQRAAPREEWRARDRSIPIWFREGMASYTARQGHRRLSEARLVDWRERTGRDPINEAHDLYQKSPEIAYSAAHWSFAFLVERYGARAVRDLLDAMYDGLGFGDAFFLVIGIPVRVFTAEYVRYLDWGGWIDRDRPRPGEVLVSQAPRSALNPLGRPVPRASTAGAAPAIAPRPGADAASRSQ